MSLRFAGDTSPADVVHVPPSPALDNIGGSPPVGRSGFAWIYPVGWGSSDRGRIFQKGTGSGETFFYLHNVAGALATFGYEFSGSGGNARAYAIDNTLSLNKAWAVAFTYRSGDGGPRLYVGDLATPMREVSSYAGGVFTRQDVTTYNSDAGFPLAFGNTPSTIRAFDGFLEWGFLFDGTLRLSDLEQLRQQPAWWRRITSGHCVGAWHFGRGRAAPDLSGFGHHALATSSTQLQPDSARVQFSPAVRTWAL